MTRWVNFREKYLHKHELQLSDYNMGSIFAQVYVFQALFTFFDFDLEKFISENWKNKFSITGPRSAVGNVSGYRCETDCRSRGREFDPGPVPYFRGD